MFRFPKQPPNNWRISENDFLARQIGNNKGINLVKKANLGSILI